MSPVLKSKSKDMSSGKSIKEQQKASTKPSPSRVNGGNVLSSAYNPASGTFHSLESAPSGALPASQSNIWFPQIHEADDQSRSSLDTAADCDSVSNNGSGSGESDDPKDKVTGIATATRPGTPIPGCDVDKRDKIRQKNEKKHQRQREKRAQELHERCSSFLMTRKLETLSQKLVPMGFPVTQATQALILNEGRIEDSVSWLLSEGKHVDAAIVDDGRPLKIDISEELATISDLEVKFKCSKQEVERLVISHEGDLEKSLLDLKMQKLETHVGAASQKVEDSSGRALAFVTFRDSESARRACSNPNPVIDGRRANCNLASLKRAWPAPTQEHMMRPMSHFVGGAPLPRGTYLGNPTHYQQGFMYSYGYYRPDYMYPQQPQNMYSQYPGQQYVVHGSPGSVYQYGQLGQHHLPLSYGYAMPMVPGAMPTVPGAMPPHPLPVTHVQHMSGNQLEQFTRPNNLNETTPALMAMIPAASLPHGGANQPMYVVIPQSPQQFTDGSGSAQTTS